MSAVPPRDSLPSAPWTNTQPDQTAQIPSSTNTFTTTTDDTTETGRRRLFGLGKKKAKETDTTRFDGSATPTPITASAFAPAPAIGSTNTENMHPASQSSPSLPSRMVAVSPPLRSLGSLSPQLSSSTTPVAPSQIFERNVQESVAPIEPSAGIPAHIQTEDHIPPVLEASSLAITDDRLDADHVEIVTHTAHQPAVDKVAEGTSSALQSDAQLPLSPQDSQHESFNSFGSHALEADETASNYGALDPSDVHRLSFISFADVVQAEQAETSSLHQVPLSSSSLAHNTQSPPLARSPSPARSPMSSQYSQDMTTPPVGSNPTSVKGFDLSPGRSPMGSPPQQHGDLNIETMRQALRKTASGDFSNVKIGSYPTSAVGGEDGSLEKHPFN